MRQKLFFKNKKGDQLSGVLSNPSSNQKKPIIILCHGFRSSKNSKTYLALEKRLNDHQLSTFRFDFYGHGESEGKFENVTVSEAKEDILCSIDYLKMLGYKKIGLIGSSFGGMASILAASETDDLFVLALKSPVSDYLGKLVAKMSTEEISRWKEQGYINYEGPKLNYSFFENAEKVDGYAATEKIKIPVLIVHGDNDESVPIEQSKRTCSLMNDCRLDVIKGADHFYSKEEDFERLLELIVGFVVETARK